MSIHIVIVFFLFHSFTLPLLKYAKRTFRVCDVDEGEFNLLLKYIQDVYGEQYTVQGPYIQKTLLQNIIFYIHIGINII